jgi:quercetin dioxygenase-like cupin family protein
VTAREGGAEVRTIEILEPQDGIKIVRAIEGAPGVDTLEGRFGPLLNAERGGCHYVDIPPGAFLADHPHEHESLIYTVRGEWVLCSRATRWHMRPGDLFWFGDGIPTGYENPFEAPAYLLIFKTQPRQPGYDDAMLTRLEAMAEKLREENRQGTPFTFAELPDDHPAKTFARTLRARVSS